MQLPLPTAAALFVAAVASDGAAPGVSDRMQGNTRAGAQSATLSPVSAPAGSKSYKAFRQEEQEFLSLIEKGGGVTDPVQAHHARKALIALYQKHGLFAETVAHWEAIAARPGSPLTTEETLDYASTLMEARRYASAFDLLKDSDIQSAQAKAILVISAQKTWAIDEAANIIAQLSKDGRFENIKDVDFLLSVAEIGLVTEDFDLVTIALKQTEAVALSKRQSAAVEAFQAMLAYDAGNRTAAIRKWRLLRVLGIEPFAARAEFRLLQDASMRGARNIDRALEALYFRTDDMAVRIGSGELRAARARESNDFALAMASYRSLIDFYPAHPARRDAARALRTLLPKLFDDGAAIAPVTAAKLFFENIEFAPPGAKGDAMIRDVVQRLQALDLMDAAAELLEHQVFKRLRGHERARVANDLAKLYLADDQPTEALRVLRSTRITGLDDDSVSDRKRTEATALHASGKSQAAILLLQDDTSIEAISLKADIRWEMADWENAAALYAELYKAVNVDGGGSSDLAEHAFLRAAVSLANSGRGVEIEKLIAGQPSGAAVQDLSEIAAALADDQRLDLFMTKYRDVFQSSNKLGG
ncbi:MAG: hypothetical protein AAFY22_13585 [Pseudomonadota bacterium]